MPVLKPGDEIRIVAPSLNFDILSESAVAYTTKRLESLGLKISFGKNISEAPDLFNSSSARGRLEDLMDAYQDTNVKAIMTIIGGFNCEELLDMLDYEVIGQNPKPILGYSDTSVLQNAIYAKTGDVQFSSPAFATFGQKNGFEYTLEYFKKALFEDGEWTVEPSKQWTTSKWFLDQDNIDWIKNEGPIVLQGGTAEGHIVGGNSGSIQLLYGTDYMPNLRGAIVFVEDIKVEEDGHDASIEIFSRDFGHLLRLPGADEIKGIVIGRFSDKAVVTTEQLQEIISRRADKLKGVPVIANADFGHTYPMFTLPIGGHAKIRADESGTAITLTC